MAKQYASKFERRRHPRTHLQIKLRGVRLDPDCGDVVDELDMTDISRSGMGAHCRRSFYPGQRVVLCLPLSGQRGRRNIYATVVRCKPNEGRYAVGMEFDVVSIGGWCGVNTAQQAA